MRNLLALILLSLTLAAPAAPRVDSDAPGSKDHPLFSRMPGFLISHQQEVAFDQATFQTGKGTAARVTVEGKKTVLSYTLKKGGVAPSRLEIIRNFEQATRKIGGEILFLGPNSKFMDLKITHGAATAFVRVDCLGSPAASRSYKLIILEQGTMEQKITANALFEAINRDGHVALDIRFDTGKAVIRPESLPILDEMVSLLNNHSELNLMIEGHTDATGTPEGNRKLSTERALAVRSALLAKGIDSSRLESRGFGQDRPVADNGTEEGRARNRRVELVKR